MKQGTRLSNRERLRESDVPVRTSVRDEIYSSEQHEGFEEHCAVYGRKRKQPGRGCKVKAANQYGWTSVIVLDLRALWVLNSLGPVEPSNWTVH